MHKHRYNTRLTILDSKLSSDSPFWIPNFLTMMVDGSQPTRCQAGRLLREYQVGIGKYDGFIMKKLYRSTGMTPDSPFWILNFLPTHHSGFQTFLPWWLRSQLTRCQAGRLLREYQLGIGKYDGFLMKKLCTSTDTTPDSSFWILNFLPIHHSGFQTFLPWWQVGSWESIN